MALILFMVRKRAIKKVKQTQIDYNHHKNKLFLDTRLTVFSLTQISNKLMNTKLTKRLQSQIKPHLLRIVVSKPLIHESQVHLILNWKILTLSKNPSPNQSENYSKLNNLPYL